MYLSHSVVRSNDDELVGTENIEHFRGDPAISSFYRRGSRNLEEKMAGAVELVIE